MCAARSLAELRSVFGHGVHRIPSNLSPAQSPFRITSVIFRRDYSIRVNLRDNGCYKHVTLKPSSLLSPVSVWPQQTRGTKITRYSQFGHKRQKSSTFQKVYFSIIALMFCFVGFNV